MAGNGFEEFFRRKRADTVPATRQSDFTPPVPESTVIRRQKGYLSDKERRRSVSDPTKRRNASMSPTGVGGLLGKLGSLLSLNTTPRVHYSGIGYNVLPQKKLVPFRQDIVASYSGPQGGLTNVGSVGQASPGTEDALSSSDDGSFGLPKENGHSVQGHGREKASTFHDKSNEKKLSPALKAAKWRLRNETAYGMSVSLYEYKNRDKTECTGDPIADVFAIRATSNSCIMAVADGVGWGQGARTAARCAVKGAMEHLWSTLYTKNGEAGPFTTTDVFKCMTDSLDEAQEQILCHDGSLTTLCLAVVADILSDDVDTKALCVLSVGDSLAFVYSQQHGVREVTVGSREYTLHRNIGICDGALGPCLGELPDLGNLTFSFTTVQEDDIVFLTSDGVSDNFDPVVARLAVPNREFKSRRSRAEMIFGENQLEAERQHNARTLPPLTPRERQEEMTRMMEIAINETEIPSENQFSAPSLCCKLLQYVATQTEKKRDAHEATNNIITICEKERLETTTMMTGREALFQHARGLPGKLDHATVVAYVVGGATAPDQPHLGAKQSNPVAKDSQSDTQKPQNYFDVSVGSNQLKGLISLID